MTKEEYEARLVEIGARMRAEMASRIKGGTHGSGYASKNIRVQVKENNHTSSHWIGFKFPKYGVFVHYGVGRGWVRQGGTVVRGAKVKKGSTAEALLKQRGYQKKDIAQYVMKTEIKTDAKSKGRKAVDWFDKVLKSYTDELAKLCTEYYGDYSVEQLSEMIDRMKIKE